MTPMTTTIRTNHWKPALKAPISDNPDSDSGTLAKLAADSILSSDDIVMIIEWAIKHIKRDNFELPIESDVFGALGRASINRSIDPVVFAGLLQSHFRLGDQAGTIVTWGMATVPQHEQRIARLQVHVRGIEETIDRHMVAIQLIEAEGVTCLNEVKAVSLGIPNLTKSTEEHANAAEA